MTVVEEGAVLDPSEFIPERVEVDLNSLGIDVLAEGIDWGESKIDSQMVREAEGESSSDGHRPGVPIKVPLRVRELGSTSLAEAAQRLQMKLGELQERGGWIRRDFSTAGGFSGSVGYKILRHTTNFQGLGGWLFAHRQDAPDVILTATRHPIAYAVVEVEGDEVSELERRSLIFELSSQLGTAPGLIRIRVVNKGSADWNSLIFAGEWEDHPQDGTASTTAALEYACSALTPVGAASIVGGDAPEVRAVGTAAGGTAAIAPALPTGTQKGDLLVMVAESGGSTEGGEANTALTAAGWTSAATAQKKGNTRLTVLYRIATGTDPTTTNSTGNHVVARIIGIKVGTFDPASPINVSAVGTQALTKAVSIPGATTTRRNCLVLACASGNLPDAGSTTEFSGVTNANLTGLTERMDVATNAGDGGAVFCASGVKATAGAYGATTVTAVTEAERGVISIAIAPRLVVRHAELTSGWVTVLSSKINGVGHMTHKGVRLPHLRAKAGGTDVQYRLRWRPLGTLAWSDDNPIVPAPVAAAFQILYLGECRLQQPVIGQPRWECQLQMRATSGAGEAELDLFWPLPAEQFACVTSPGSDLAPENFITKAPGTVADDSSIGGDAWSNASNAKSSDNTYATVFFTTEKGSHYLKATNFGAALPSAATPTDIEVLVEGKRDPEFAVEPQLRAVLVVAGSVVASTDRPLSPLMSKVDSVYTAVFSAQDLGITKAQIEQEGFGVAIYLKSFVGEEFVGGTTSIDQIRMRPYYSEAADESKVCFSGRSVEIGSTGIYRQNPTDDIWGRLAPAGFYPRAMPAGLEERKSRYILIPSQGNLDDQADVGANPLSALPATRAGYHYTPEGA